MKLLITYDVTTVDKEGEKRLRQVARTCLDYGQRVQKSVFECEVGSTELVLLRGRLLEAIKPETDSVRIYFLDGDTRIETHGVDNSRDMGGPLVV